MARMIGADRLPLLVERVEQRIELDSRQAKHGVDAEACQGANDGLAAGHAFGHRKLPRKLVLE
jgi:hypothetical protein